MHVSRKIVVGFVNIVYEGTLFGLYFLYDHWNGMILMEDGAPLQLSI